jgi:hypothetical protein
MPLGYLAILIMVTLFLVLIMHYVLPALYTFAFFWYLGKLINDYYDPHAWGLLAKNLKLPARLVP